VIKQPYSYGNYKKIPGSEVYYNPNTQNVVVTENGKFLTGFKLEPGTDQYTRYMTTEDLK